MLALLILCMLLIATYIKQRLFDGLFDQLKNQQFTTVSVVAAQLDNAFTERMELLQTLAESIPSEMLENPEAVQFLLNTRSQRQNDFNNGVIVLRHDGLVIADSVIPEGRIGKIYSNKGAISQTLLGGKSTVGVPRLINRSSDAAFDIAVPVHHRDKSVAGAVVGVTELRKKNFLDPVTSKRYGANGGYLLIAPTDRLLVAGMNKNRFMEKLPAPGKNIVMDRFLSGYEGTAILNHASGVEMLSSVVKVPSAGWLLAATLPTEEAFAPLNRNWTHIYLGMLVLSAASAFICWWILKRQFSPLTETIKTLDEISNEQTKRHSLPVKSHNEIGKLIRAFNRLLNVIAIREDSLEKSEALTRSIINSVAAEIAVLNQDGTIIMVNQPWQTFLNEHGHTGIGVVRGNGVGSNYLRVCENSAKINGNQDAVKASDGIKAVLNGSASNFSMEYACESPGGIKWFNLIVTPLNHSGFGVVLSHTNVTERRQAQDALYLSELRFRTMLTNVPGISIRGCREDGLIHYWNHASESLFGYSAEEAIGKHMAELIGSSEFHSGVESAIDANSQLRMATLAGEFSLKRKDGQTVQVYSARTIIDIPGQTPELFYIDIDLTAKKKTEKALELTRIILDVASDAVFWITAESRIINANAAACYLLNYSRDELLELELPDICVDTVQCRANWETYFAGLKKFGSLKLEDEFRNKDGRIIPVEVVVNYIQFDEIELNCAFVRDISERKASEHALMTAKLAAERANMAKTNFLAVASHDLRQPISALSLYIDLIKPSMQPEQRPVINYIGDCVSSLAELMTDLLDISKLDSGVVIPRKSEFRIDDLLSRLVSIHSVQSEAKGVRIQLRESGLTVSSDYRLLQRIIGNIVSNAVSFTAKGRVLIACRKREGRFWVEIWDTGIGIPEDQYDAVFEEFKQLSDEPKSNGSGLGLAIVLKMTRLLGLRLRLCSKVGIGTMFAVEIPVVQ